MGFIHQDPDSAFMGKPCQFLQIGTDPIVGRIIDKYSHRIRIFIHCFLHGRNRNTQGNPNVVIHFDIHVNGDTAAQNQGIDHAFMDIPGQDDLVPLFADR